MGNHQLIKNNKILVSIAEDNDLDLLQINTAIRQTQHYQRDIAAENGRDLILKLTAKKALPQLIFMDMQMPCCDGLLCTTICKALFPKIKIVGLSSHTSPIVIGEFLAEGGDAFLTKYMLVKGSIPFLMYKDDSIFEKALDAIVYNNVMYIDMLSQFEEATIKTYSSTKSIIAAKYPSLKESEILYLHLNAAGFIREQIGLLMNISLGSVKKCCSKLSKVFNVANSHDLANICISLGIAKIVKLYQ